MNEIDLDNDQDKKLLELLQITWNNTRPNSEYKEEQKIEDLIYLNKILRYLNFKLGDFFSDKAYEAIWCSYEPIESIIVLVLVKLGFFHEHTYVKYAVDEFEKTTFVDVFVQIESKLRRLEGDVYEFEKLYKNIVHI